jgi:hypothetical protein
MRCATAAAPTAAACRAPRRLIGTKHEGLRPTRPASWSPIRPARERRHAVQHAARSARVGLRRLTGAQCRVFHSSSQRRTDRPDSERCFRPQGDVSPCAPARRRPQRASDARRARRSQTGESASERRRASGSVESHERSSAVLPAPMRGTPYLPLEGAGYLASLRDTTSMPSGSGLSVAFTGERHIPFGSTVVSRPRCKRLLGAGS